MTIDKVPVLSAEEIIKALVKIGFVNTRRSKGSHFRYVHPDGRRTTVPVHKKKDISKGLLKQILKDINVSLADFKKLLKK
jgi:predicted RNA binding protein YcfA (HicA-like mRNA interferase family)